MIFVALIGTVLAASPQKVPENTTVGPTASVRWLLSEMQYKNCLTFAAHYATIEGRLEQCEEAAAPALQKSEAALLDAKSQILRDSKQIADLLDDKREARNKIANLRRQRNTAYAIAGSLVLGSATTALLVLR